MSDAESSPPPSPKSTCSEPVPPTHTRRQYSSNDNLVKAFVDQLETLNQHYEETTDKLREEQEGIRAQLQDMRNKLDARQAELAEQMQKRDAELARQKQQRKGARDRAIQREETIRELQTELQNLHATLSDATASVQEVQRTNERLEFLDTERNEHNKRMRNALESMKGKLKQFKLEVEEVKCNAAISKQEALHDSARVGTTLLAEEIAKVDGIPKPNQETFERIASHLKNPGAELNTARHRKAPISQIKHQIEALSRNEAFTNSFKAWSLARLEFSTAQLELCYKRKEAEVEELTRMNALYKNALIDMRRRVASAVQLFENFELLTGKSLEQFMEDMGHDAASSN